MRIIHTIILLFVVSLLVMVGLTSSENSNKVWEEELMDKPLEHARLSEINIVPGPPKLKGEVVYGVDEYEVGELPSKKPRRKVFRHIFYPDASIGFSSIGNCIPLALVPAVSLNITDKMSVELGAGAGYKSNSTENSDKSDRDDYAIWFAKIYTGFTLRDLFPRFEFNFQFISLFQGVDYVHKGNPEPEVPLFDGYLRASLWYGDTHSTNLLRWGWSTSLTLSYYFQNYYTISASVFYGFKPLVLIKSKTGKHMFGMVYNASVNFDHYGTFQDPESYNIDNYFRSSYKFSVTSGQTIDKPFSIYWKHNLRFSGPVLWEIRPYGRLFFQMGGTWGPHYYDRANTSFEWEMSTGLELAIGIHDYVGGAIRMSVPMNRLGATGEKRYWEIHFSFSAYLEEV